MSEQNKVNNDSPIRVNQNFSKYSRLLGKVETNEGIIPYENSKTVIKNLLYYFSQKEQQIQKELYGQIKVDLNEFCNEFGYKVNTFQNRVTNIGSIPIYGSKEKHEVSNDFEGYLLEIAKQNIPIKFKNSSGNHSIKFVPVISELEIAKSSSSKKRVYLIKLHDDYKKTLLNFYNTSHPMIYKGLKKNNKRTTGLQDTYLAMEYLKSIAIAKNGLKSSLMVNISFESLVSLLDISENHSPSQKKKYINQKISLLQKEASTVKKLLSEARKKDKSVKIYDFSFELVWKKTSSSSYAYSPYFKFTFTEDYISVLKQTQNESALLFENLFIQKLAEEYDKTSKSYDLDKWVNDQDIDMELKRNIFINLHIQVHNKKPDEWIIKKKFTPKVIRDSKNT